LLKPGDAVMVDDPGYFNLFGNLQLHGLTLLPVPRTPEGPDVQAIQDLQTLHRPKVFFTQSALHNPTGTSLSTPNAFRLLQLAEQYNFRIVENDSYMDLVSIPTNRLAALDQLNRVIFIGSFSKTVSASVRVGYLACHADLAEQIANIKMLTSITSAQLNEQLVHHVLTDGHYRRHMERLRSMLADAMRQTLGHLDKSGFEFFAQPVGGKFVWVRHPQFDDSSDISRLAAANDIILAPGSVFRPDLSPTAWLRFNVAQSLQPSLHTFLKKTFR
jgi:DNA-binding transcriptional MocR family regulator